MKNDVRFFAFTLVLIVALLGGGAIYERLLRERKEDARITKIQIVECKLESERPRVWTWKGAAMKPVLAGWKIYPAIRGCDSLNGAWFELRATGRKGVIWKWRFNLTYAEVTQKNEVTGKYVFAELTPRSLLHFRCLLAKTKPDSK